MQFDKDQFFTDYLTRGMYVFNAAEILRKIDIDRFKAVTVQHEDGCFHAEGHEYHENYQEQAIKQLMKDLSEIVLKDFQHDLVFDFFAPEVNMNVRKWHGDPEYNMPNQNTSVNCFFDDTGPEIGGCFEMVPYTPELHGTDTNNGDPRIAIAYPKKYDIIIFNQNRTFIHKATASKNPRRMLSFGCTLKDFNSIIPAWVES